MDFIALLRGINVGGNKKVPMADAKKVFEGLGFTEVRTFLASGNIRFKVAKGRPTLEELTATLEAALKKKFGFEIPVLLRSLDSIQSLVKENPFKGIPVTPETRLYVTFIEGKPLVELKLPYETPEKDFKILCKTKDGAVCSVLTLLRGRGSVDAMTILEKTYGKKITTRNWNTVLKLIKS